MTMPLDLVLVRHGQSEGNLAKKLREKGIDAYDKVRKGRHTRSWRLSELGKSEAAQAGAFIETEFGRFDRYYVSEYARAVETAHLLALKDATWYIEYFLVERDWGELDRCTEAEREKRFGATLALKEVEPFFVRPENGESIAALCMRIKHFLDTLHRECSDKRVIVVCHGEVMWAFRILLERMSQEMYRDLHKSKSPKDRIYNCDIIHYSRHHPVTGALESRMNHVRFIRPTLDPVLISPWQTIVRPKYSNEDLEKILKQYPRVLDR